MRRRSRSKLDRHRQLNLLIHLHILHHHTLQTKRQVPAIFHIHLAPRRPRQEVNLERRLFGNILLDELAPDVEADVVEHDAAGTSVVGHERLGRAEEGDENGHVLELMGAGPGV